MEDGYYLVGTVNTYCSKGWTRIYQNTFTSDHDDVTFAESSSCACPGSGINNNAGAHSSSGWHVGVTGCPSTNAQTRTIGGQSIDYAWGFVPNVLDVGTVSAIRHKGVHHENHGAFLISKCVPFEARRVGTQRSFRLTLRQHSATTFA